VRACVRVCARAHIFMYRAKQYSHIYNVAIGCHYFIIALYCIKNIIYFCIYFVQKHFRKIMRHGRSKFL